MLNRPIKTWGFSDTPTIVTLAGLKWQLEPLPGRGLRITAPPGFRVNWQTGIRVMNREWTEIELELEERDKGDCDTGRL